jgi:predicted glutamate--cysteine ligase
LADANDQEVARRSLEAPLHHWRDGQEIVARDWIAALLEEVRPLAAELGLSPWLEPLQAVMQHGNQTMLWLEQHRQGSSIAALMAEGALQMERQEQQLSAPLATEARGPLG